MPPARSERLRSVAASGVARKATHALSLSRPRPMPLFGQRRAGVDALARRCSALQTLQIGHCRRCRRRPSHPIPSTRWKQTRLTLADSWRNGLRFADCCYPWRSVSSVVTTHCAVQPSLIRVDRTARVGLAVPFGPRRASPRLANSSFCCPLCFTARVGLAALSRRKHRLHDMCGFAAVLGAWGRGQLRTVRFGAPVDQ